LGVREIFSGLFAEIFSVTVKKYVLTALAISK
jgi:hypothetical protein